MTVKIAEIANRSLGRKACKMKKIDFRETIRKGLEARNMNIAELTKEAGCGQMAIYNYLAGRTEMKADLLARVLCVLQIAVTVERIKKSR